MRKQEGIDEAYISSLQDKRLKVDQRMEEREKEQQKSLNLFLDHIKKELEMLTTDKEKISDRNKEFNQEMKRHAEEFRLSMADIVQATEELNQCKAKYAGFLREYKR